MLIKDCKRRKKKNVRGKEKCTHSVQEIPRVFLVNLSLKQVSLSFMIKFSEIIKTM